MVPPRPRPPCRPAAISSRSQQRPCPLPASTATFPRVPAPASPLPDALAHHALAGAAAARAKPLVLFNGRGGEYSAVPGDGGQAGFAQLGEFVPREAELAGRVTLVQGPPSGDKMDWVVEKAVELGAARVSPIAAQRSVLQLSGPRLEKRVAHWQRIAQSASEQCGRNRLMAVDAPLTLAEWLAQPSGDLRLRVPPGSRGRLSPPACGPRPACRRSPCWWAPRADGRTRNWPRPRRRASRRCASARGCCAPRRPGWRWLSAVSALLGW